MLILNIVVPTFHMLIGIRNNQIKHKVAIPVTSCLPFNCWIPTLSSLFSLLDNQRGEDLPKNHLSNTTSK